MIARKTLNRPIAMMVMGTPVFLVALLWPHIPHAATGFGDGFQGALFGIWIGINLCAVWIAVRNRGVNKNRLH